MRKIAERWNEVGPVFSPDGKHVVTGREKGEIDFWEVDTGKLARTLTMPREGHPTSLAYSPDGKRLAVGSSDHAVHVWDLASGKALLPADHRLGGTPSVRLLPDGKALVAHCRYEVNRRHPTVDPRLSSWELQGKLVRQARLCPERSHVMRLSRDGRTVASGNGPNYGFMFRPIPNGGLRSSTRLCDVGSGKQLVRVEDVPCQLYDLTFSPDGRFLLVNAANAGQDTEDFQRVHALQIWERKSVDALE